MFSLYFSIRRFVSGGIETMRLDNAIELQECWQIVRVVHPPFWCGEIGLERCNSLSLILLPQLAFVLRLRLSFGSPLNALTILFVRIDPVWWHAMILDRVHQECGR